MGQTTSYKVMKEILKTKKIVQKILAFLCMNLKFLLSYNKVKIIQFIYLYGIIHI